MLEAVVRYNLADGNLSPQEIGAYYEDQRLGIKLGASDGTQARYVFANDEGATLVGYQQGDYLFGGAGNDTIYGGGAGLDALRRAAPDGLLHGMMAGERHPVRFLAGSLLKMPNPHGCASKCRAHGRVNGAGSIRAWLREDDGLKHGS